jgi:hypothetical protein
MPTIDSTTTQGGYLQNQLSTSTTLWSDIVDGTVTTATFIAGDPTYIYTQAGVIGSRTTDWLNSRASLVFDTSGITGTVIALTFNIYIQSYFNTYYNPGAYVEIVSDPTLSNILASSDWVPGITGLAASSPLAPGGSGFWLGTGLNSTAFSYAETYNEMTLRLRDAYYDYEYSTNVTDPTDDGYIGYRFNYSGFIPYLDYQVATAFGQTINGTIIANVGKIDGKSKNAIVRVLGV